MAVVILALVCSTAWAGEPNETPIHLEFEISPTPLIPYSASRPPSSPEVLWRPLASQKPAYAATIPVVGPTEFLPSVARGLGSDFLSFAEQWAGLSERQKAFLGAARVSLQNHSKLLLDRPDPNGPERLLLYAVTLEDAQKTAQAYFQYATRKFRRQVAGAEYQIRIATENIESAEKRIAEIEKQSEAARQAMEELQKTVPYRTESEAHAAIGELDRMLNAAQVEIAGIKACLTAIQGYQQERRAGPYKEVTTADGKTVRVLVQQGKTSPEATAKLDMMFIEESIALRGAQAREQMATRLREQANRFVDLKSTLANAPGEKKALTETLTSWKGNLSSWQGNLANTKQQQPQIPAKVVICPVLWADEPAQN
jgi:hypothetical protein